MNRTWTWYDAEIVCTITGFLVLLGGVILWGYDRITAVEYYVLGGIATLNFILSLAVYKKRISVSKLGGLPEFIKPDEVLESSVNLEEERGGRDNRAERIVEERRKEMLKQQTLELQKEREFEESLYRLRGY